jgi:hypothetical protein
LKLMLVVQVLLLRSLGIFAAFATALYFFTHAGLILDFQLICVLQYLSILGQGIPLYSSFADCHLFNSLLAL